MKLKTILQKNGYSAIHLLINAFKRFLDQLHVVKDKVETVEKKQLLIVLPYLGTISLQARTKLQKTLRTTLSCCKVSVIF